MKQKLFLLFLGFLIPFQIWGISVKDAYPNPSLNPSDVVKMQLSAMQQNDASNLGIEVTFRFASPSNRRYTGPLERFISLVKNPSYKHLLNHLDVNFMDPIIENGMAIQDVILTTSTGKRIGYRFRLSLQQNEQYKDCWMTDAVTPFQVPEVSA